MDEMMKQVPVLRLDDGNIRQIPSDNVGREHVLSLCLNGEVVFTNTASPQNLREWSAGVLLCGGHITSADQIKSIERKQDRILTTVTGPGETDHTSAAKTRFTTVSPAAIFDGAAWIAQAPCYLQTGGFHAAAVMSLSGERVFLVEDIGRHNALDKALGHVLLNDIPFGDVFVIQSGRLARDMVEKAVRAGIFLLGSVSAPTAEGVEIAKTSGLALVGFIRNKRMNIYSRPESVETGNV